MTLEEFFLITPSNIYHKTSGYAELELVTNSRTEKTACYRHKDKTAHFLFSAKTWVCIYERVMKNLRSEGYARG